MLPAHATAPADTIRYIHEPHRLSLTWHPTFPTPPEHRTWRRVGELSHDSGTVTLTYLAGTPDYEEAVKQGFTGHPAFPAKQAVHKTGVLESFMKRLPPRTRRDFPEYLQMFRLPVDVQLSDFALLGYTGARLPSDDFAILLPLEDFTAPYEIVAEVAGFRHETQVAPTALSVGDSVTLGCEPHPKDEHAVNVLWHGKKLGHILRLYAPAIGSLVQQNRLTATIVRVNGSADRPVVRLFITVR